jgi:hypothetical protein
MAFCNFITRPMLRLTAWFLLELSALFQWIIGGHPPDHRATLALDHLSRLDLRSLMSPMRPRFKAFHDRAVLHSGFIADGFVWY